MAKKSKKAPKGKAAKAKKSEDVNSLVADAENALANFEMQAGGLDFVGDVLETHTISAKDFDQEMEEAEVDVETEEADVISISANDTEESIEAAADAEAQSNDSEIETIIGTAAELDGFDPADVDGDDEADEDYVNEFAGESQTDGLAGTELEGFASAEIEVVEELPIERIASVVESLLFSSDKPQSVAMLKAAFIGTKVKSADIRKAIALLETQFANAERGVEVYEISGGYQLRTKVDNAAYLQKTIKARPFRLSGPALEVMAIVAYKQPCAKVQVDEIRGVESGHLMRGLLERGLIAFGEKSDLPGRPMYYETTRKFLEIFGLRQIEELPTLNEIDQLIPEGIGEPVEEKQTLSDVTEEMSQNAGTTYSEGEEELQSISSDLSNINLSTAFFEEEKKRVRDAKDLEKAQEIRERQVIGEAVTTRELNWLAKFDNGTLYVAKEFPKGKFGKKSEGSEAGAEASAEGSSDAQVDEALNAEAQAEAESEGNEMAAAEANLEATDADQSGEADEAQDADESEDVIEEPHDDTDIDAAIVEPLDEPIASYESATSEDVDPLEKALQSLREDNKPSEPESEV